MMQNFVRTTESSAFPKAPCAYPMPLPAHAVQSSDPACWEYLYQPDINLAICARTPSSELLTFAHSAVGFDFGMTLMLSDVRTLDTHILKNVRSLPGYHAWLDDVGYWMDAFQCLLGVGTVGLRLRTLDLAMCPRFHVDNIPARLVTTYGAIGSEWLANADVDRTQLGLRANNLSDREVNLYRGEAVIRRLPAFSVALMKGESWQGNEGLGLVHRSPAITPCQRRLLLTLDPVDHALPPIGEQP